MTETRRDYEGAVEQMASLDWQRIWGKVEIGDCWTWIGYLDSAGYGIVSAAGGQFSIHRLVWTYLVGPVPRWLELDHLCRNRACVNPDHLEPVTHAENIRRGQSGAPRRNRMTCPQGHPYSKENTYIGPTRGERRCKTCREAEKQVRQMLGPGHVSGERVWSAKLTWERVRLLRRLVSEKQKTRLTLLQDFDISPSQYSKIIGGRAWRE